MSRNDGDRRFQQGPLAWSSPTETQSHTEHQAALEATLFRSASDPYELVLELDGGHLKIRPPDVEPV